MLSTPTPITCLKQCMALGIAILGIQQTQQGGSERGDALREVIQPGSGKAKLYGTAATPVRLLCPWSEGWLWTMCRTWGWDAN